MTINIHRTGGSDKPASRGSGRSSCSSTYSVICMHVDVTQQDDMLSFTFEAHIPRTVFGSGTLSKIPEEVERLGAKRVLVVTENTARQLDLAANVKESLGPKLVGM